ncbi:efflux RND transporter periplasmic adaptor subunit [Marinobacter lacisalsi]|uniref:Efflux RND transporter periplasmic adaptor subunit n=1 Tax=Marinobacter lacisalsi TaxID=475979 RepID=A0ABV8QHI9_9GAMM
MTRRLIPIVIIIAGLLVFQVLRMTRPEPEPVGQTERAWPVQVMSVAPASLRPALPVYGEVTAPDLMTVTASVSGQVSERPVGEGEAVNEGDLLVAMAPADVQPPLRQAQAEVADLAAQIRSEQIRAQTDRKALAREQAVRDSARRQLERTRSLQGSNLTSQRDVDNARDALEQAELAVTLREQNIAGHPATLASLEARLQRAEAALAAARRDAERATATAPFPGIVARVEVARGDRVTAGSPLLSLYRPDAMEIRARIPSAFARDLDAELDRGRAVEAVSEDRRYQFRLVRFAGESDPRGPLGIFRLQGDSSGLRPGELVPLVVFRPPLENVVAVPYSALYGSDDLYVMTDEQRMHRVPVERVGQVLVEDGHYDALVRSDRLNEGVRIITTHLPNAIEGLKVSVAKAPEALAE